MLFRSEKAVYNRDGSRKRSHKLGSGTYQATFERGIVTTKKRLLGEVDSNLLSDSHIRGQHEL